MLNLFRPCKCAACATKAARRWTRWASIFETAGAGTVAAMLCFSYQTVGDLRLCAALSVAFGATVVGRRFARRRAKSLRGLALRRVGRAARAAHPVATAARA